MWLILSALDPVAGLFPAARVHGRIVVLLPVGFLPVGWPGGRRRIAMGPTNPDGIDIGNMGYLSTGHT